MTKSEEIKLFTKIQKMINHSVNDSRLAMDSINNDSSAKIELNSKSIYAVETKIGDYSKTITKQMLAGVGMPMLNARLRAGTYMVNTDADHYIVSGTCKILGQGDNFAITRDAYISIVAICDTDKIVKLTINKI